MEKNIKISILCEIYGKMLTEKQYTFIDDYYNNDLSLSEIAENNNITRQAVRDVLKQAENKLFEFEEKLELMKKNEKQENIIRKIFEDIEKTKENIKDENTKKYFTNIEKQLKSLGGV